MFYNEEYFPLNINAEESLHDNIQRVMEEFKLREKEFTDADALRVTVAYIDVKNNFDI